MTSATSDSIACDDLAGRRRGPRATRRSTRLRDSASAGKASSASKRRSAGGRGLRLGRRDAAACRPRLGCLAMRACCIVRCGSRSGRMLAGHRHAIGSRTERLERRYGARRSALGSSGAGERVVDARERLVAAQRGDRLEDARRDRAAR